MKKEQKKKAKKVKQRDWTAEAEAREAESKQLLKLIDEQLSRTAHKVETRSLWELAASVVHWLELAHKDHPVVRDYITSKDAMEKFLDKTLKHGGRRVIMSDHVWTIEWRYGEIFLLVGLLMGIRAVENFGINFSIDTDKAASAYRLKPKHRDRPPITKEQLKQWQLESAAYGGTL